MKSNKFKIAIIGAGYVGLDLAIAFSKKFPVICYDINNARIQELMKGLDNNKQHKKNEILNKSLTFSSNTEFIKNLNFYLVTVPTPINKSNNPDLSMLKDASKLVGKSIKKKSIVVYESTTFPGCTEEICIPIIENVSKLKFNKDFHVAYSPERVNPGDKLNILRTITKIVGANDYKTLLKVKRLYKEICNSIFPVLNMKVAESAKVIENIQRDINIALVNELSILFNKLNIPTNEVLKAASTKWNFHYYKPGLVGGHCISIDPYYLAYKSKTKNYNPKIILSGRKLNESMASYVASQTLNLIKDANINLNNSRIAVLGFAFKENIPDIRNTKIIKIIDHLTKSNVKFDVFDPVVDKKEVRKIYQIQIKNINELKKYKYDAIILAVSHREFLKKINYYSKFYKNRSKKIFIDLKNNYKLNDLIKNKFIYFQL
jgi:UDP-N-acetyl-D-glucosamine/UDP-N-acetyl-D-galactosamine dehydrogenase